MKFSVMKLILVFVIAVSSCFCLTSSPAYQDEFLKSFEAWQNWDPETYTYITSFNSWVGYGQRTEIKVSHHQVVRREFESWEKYLTRTSTTRTIESYVEDTPQTIGTHETGFPPKTMEQIYQQCLEDVLYKDTKENDIFFVTDERGIIKQCQYYPHFCSDDCLFGISLDQVIF